MTPREPDRLDAQARELARQLFGGWPVTAETIAKIADFGRAAESSALERAAQLVNNEDEGRTGRGFELGDVGDFRKRCVDGIRALIPPAAAPAADLRSEYERSLSMPIDGGKRALDRVDAVLAKHAPAAETGKAQGAEARTGSGFGQFCPRCPCVVATYQEKCPACGGKMWTPEEWWNALAPLVAARRRLHVLRASVALEPAATMVDQEWLKAVGEELEKCHLEVHSVATAFAARAAPPEEPPAP